MVRGTPNRVSNRNPLSGKGRAPHSQLMADELVHRITDPATAATTAAAKAAAAAATMRPTWTVPGLVDTPPR
jgi:hypothetical protein